MSDTKTYILPQERHVDPHELQQMMLDRRQSQIHTAMPAQIVSYDPAKMTVTVQPALQLTHFKRDGTREPVTIAHIQDVPVWFPSGGGHILTFPIAAGDECLLVFSERSIDFWYQHGGVQKPSDLRMHDINDPICLVGMRPQTGVLGGAASGRSSGPAAHGGAAQLRSDDGNTVITLDGPGGGVTIKTGGVTIVSNAGGVTLTAPTVTIKGDLKVTGEVTAKSGGGFVTLSQHIQAGQKPIPNT
jgi:hypothetical protein